MAPRSRARATSRTRRPQTNRSGKKTNVRTKPEVRAPRRKSRSSMRKSRKRPLNGFFKLMLKAKANGDESFVYNGQTYKGKKHPKLKMIYKKA